MEITAGAAVQLKSGEGPLMTVLGPHEKPTGIPGITDLSALDWRPGHWRVAWHVQGALRTAVLPGAALRVVRTTDQLRPFRPRGAAGK